MCLHFLSKRHSVKESGKTVPLPHLPPLPAASGPVEPWGSCPVTEAGFCRRPTPRPPRLSRARPASFLLHPRRQQTHPHRKAGGGPSSTARTSSSGARNCKTSGSDESQGRERVRKPARGGENPCILGIIPAASTLTSFLCFSD